MRTLQTLGDIYYRLAPEYHLSRMIRSTKAPFHHPHNPEMN
jgi:hypothetical protein